MAQSELWGVDAARGACCGGYALATVVTQVDFGLMWHAVGEVPGQRFTPFAAICSLGHLPECSRLC